MKNLLVKIVPLVICKIFPQSFITYPLEQCDYEVEFSAGDLSRGIFFYRMQVDYFANTFATLLLK